MPENEAEQLVEQAIQEGQKPPFEEAKNRVREIWAAKQKPGPQPATDTRPRVIAEGTDYTMYYDQNGAVKYWNKSTREDTRDFPYGDSLQMYMRANPGLRITDYILATIIIQNGEI